MAFIQFFGSFCHHHHHHHHHGWSIEMQIRCARYWQVSIRGGRDGLYICSSGVARNSVARSGRKVKDINVKEFCLFYVQLWLWHLKNIVFQNSIWKFKTPGMRRRWCVGGTATKAQDSRDGAVVIQLARWYRGVGGQLITTLMLLTNVTWLVLLCQHLSIYTNRRTIKPSLILWHFG